MTASVVLASMFAAVNPNNGNSIPPGLWFAIAAVIVIVGVIMIARRKR